jgi:hypothetical protein
MNEDCAKEATREYPNPMPDVRIGIKESIPELLRVAQRIEQFVNDNGWSWCMMDRVYKILNAAHR